MPQAAIAPEKEPVDQPTDGLARNRLHVLDGLDQEKRKIARG